MGERPAERRPAGAPTFRRLTALAKPPGPGTHEKADTNGLAQTQSRSQTGAPPASHPLLITPPWDKTRTAPRAALRMTSPPPRNSSTSAATTAATRNWPTPNAPSPARRFGVPPSGGPAAGHARRMVSSKAEPAEAGTANAPPRAHCGRDKEGLEESGEAAQCASDISTSTKT